MPARNEWDTTAQQLGYDSEKLMLEDYYITRRLSLAVIARKLGTCPAVISAHLTKQGIATRKRGGANNQKVVFSEELAERVRKEGVQAVADDLKIGYSALYKVIYRARGKSRRQEKADSLAASNPEQPEQLLPPPAPETQDEKGK